MREPETSLEHRAYRLAADHAVKTIRRYPECKEWTDQHWQEFLVPASHPEVQETQDREQKKLIKELKKIDRAMKAAGPEPSMDAPESVYLAWMDRVDEELKQQR